MDNFDPQTTLTTMRIKGLPKLLMAESRPRKLKGGRVVLDGQNFFHDSYKESKLPDKIGIEANEFAKHLRQILQMFKSANIELFVLFRGREPNLDKKVKELDTELENSSGIKYKTFKHVVLKQVLQENGIKYSTSVLDCKRDCVALAKSLNCPVLSNDLMFAFKRVPYISTLSIKYSHKNKSILCKEFRLNKFLNKYSLTARKLAIFAALRDELLFPLNHFDKLLAEWNVHDQNIVMLQIRLLKWLSNHSEDDAVNGISKFLTNVLDNVTFFNHNNNILSYMVDDSESVVANYLKNNRSLSAVTAYPYPEWFAKGVAAGNIDPSYIYLYMHKCILLTDSWTKVGEAKTANDTVMLSIGIIIYGYNLLVNYSPTHIKLLHNSEDYMEIDTATVSKPSYQCTTVVFENGWENIKKIKLFEHFLITNDLDTDKINKLPNEARMLFISLVYFSRKKSTNSLVTNTVYIYIVSYVLLHVVFNKNPSRKARFAMNEEDCARVIEETKNYFIYKMCDVDERLLYTLNESRYCLLHMNHLNKLCGSPFMPTIFHRMLNDTYMYNVLTEMADNDGGDKKYVMELFKTAPSVCNYIEKLINNYQELYDP